MRCILLLGFLKIYLPAKLVVYNWELKTSRFSLEGATIANEISQTEDN